MATTVIDTYTLSAGKYSIIKDPQAFLDYEWNWTAYLALIADTIVSCTYVIDGTDNALIQSNVTNSTTRTKVWLAAGTVGVTYRVTAHITMASGRIDDRSIFVKITQR